MATDHFVADGFCHIFKSEKSGFLRHLRVEHDLKQQVTEFVLKARHVFALYSVGNFVGFFNGIWCDAGKILREIPFASGFWVAQSGHDRKEARKLGICWRVRIWADVVHPWAPDI